MGGAAAALARLQPPVGKWSRSERARFPGSSGSSRVGVRVAAPDETGSCIKKKFIIRSEVTGMWRRGAELRIPVTLLMEIPQQAQHLKLAPSRNDLLTPRGHLAYMLH